MKHFCFILITFSMLCPMPTLHAQDRNNDIASILTDKMQVSAQGWNEGDFDQFMSPYWVSDSLIYMGKDTVTMGFSATLNRYKENYPDAKARGQLNFEFHKVNLLDPNHAIMIARYTLTRERESVSGNFLLIWEFIDHGWYIVLDFSS